MLAHLMVLEANNTNSALSQESLALLVGLSAILPPMSAAVYLNGQLAFRAIEIKHIVVDDMLPPELAAGDASTAKGAPEQFLRARRAASQGSRSIDVRAFHFNPSPGPLPAGLRHAVAASAAQAGEREASYRPQRG